MFGGLGCLNKARLHMFVCDYGFWGGDGALSPVEPRLWKGGWEGPYGVGTMVAPKKEWPKTLEGQNVTRER
jgi:hypothetical protein